MRTVIHLTTDDADDCEHAMRCASLLWGHEELPHEDVTLLPHRGGVEMVVPGSAHEDRMRDLLENDVSVTVGATCFDARDRPREALPGVEIVPSGVSELVRLQSDGYNYVKIP